MEKTKVFISWSGARSLAVAKSLRYWLPRVIQAVDPWLSEKDIEKGSQWFSEVMTAMRPSKFAIVCLTPENVTSPWLHFEAGAIAMNFESRICTYLVGEMRFSDVKPPLNQFQITTQAMDQTFSLIETINKHLSALLDVAVLRDTFEALWPKWENELKTIATTEHKGAALQHRSDREVLDEVLEHIRGMRRLQEESELRAAAGRALGFPAAARAHGISSVAGATGPRGPTGPENSFSGGDVTLQFSCPSCGQSFSSWYTTMPAMDSVLVLKCVSCGWTGQKTANEAIHISG